MHRLSRILTQSHRTNCGKVVVVVVVVVVVFFFFLIDRSSLPEPHV